MSAAYCAKICSGAGPGSSITSTTPLSLIQYEVVPSAPEAVLPREMSTNVSDGLNHSAAAVVSALWPMRSGTPP